MILFVAFQLYILKLSKNLTTQQSWDHNNQSLIYKIKVLDLIVS